MQEVDRRTAVEVPSALLMERAGRGVYRSLRLRLGSLRQRRFVVLCGKGMNGGDGFVVARLLRERGLWPEVACLVEPDSLSGDAAWHARRLSASGVRIDDGGLLPRRLTGLEPRDVVIDAILGTGTTGAPRGLAADWVEALRATRATVVAVDLPTGIAADTPRPEGAVAPAAWTVTMAALKRALPFPPARQLAGPVDVVDIGVPPAVLAEVSEKGPSAARLSSPGELREWLPSPAAPSQKGDWGKLVVAGGAPGMPGALALAAEAALRTGVGLVRIALPRTLAPILNARLAEAMTLALPEGEDGQLTSAGADRIASDFGDWDALVLGPGLGRSPEAQRFALRLLGRWRGPLLVDADGLNALAAFGPESWVPRAHDARAGGRPGGMVLTPHLGEMSRLVNKSIAELSRDPIEEARYSAARWQATLVLKGAPTVVAAPDGRVWVNSTGNSGLSTGGSGDVLSGVIGALLAQGLDGPSAAVLGVYLHGAAADEAVRNGGPLLPSASAQRALLPRDVIASLGPALWTLEQGLDPPNWSWRYL